MIQRIFLIIKEIISQRFISLIVFFAIIVAVFAVGVFQIGTYNFNNYIQNKFGTSIPPNFIRVTPKPTGGFGLIQLKKPSGSKLTEKDLARIVKLSGVKGIHPYMTVKIPLQAVIHLDKLIQYYLKKTSPLGAMLPLANISFGKYRTDLICIGAPYSMIKNDILGGGKNRDKWLNWKPGEAIPVLVPQFFLDAYNQSMAEGNNLPKIPASMVKDVAGVNFADILFGRSSFKEIPGFEVVPAHFFGTTENVKSLALIIPLSVARYYNKKFQTGNADKEYIYTYVEVKNHKSLIPVSKQIEKLGFIVQTEVALSREIQTLRDTVNMIIEGLKWVVVGLSMLAIAFSTTIATLNRIEYYRILRVLGASKTFITITIIIKYALVGYLGSLLGIWITHLIVQNQLSHLLKIFPIPNIKLDLTLKKELVSNMILAGIIIPVVSTLPTLIKIYFKGLNQD